MAALQSIPVPNNHSGADYLLPDFGGPRCLQASPISAYFTQHGRDGQLAAREIDIRTGRVTSALELEGWGARANGGYVQVAMERNDNVRALCWASAPLLLKCISRPLSRAC